MPHEQAVEIIRQGRGSHFDPDICDAFLACVEQFQAIAERFADTNQDMAAKQAALERSGQTP
ncbi:hypothetical protein D3C87_1980010 [compost metagenome]